MRANMKDFLGNELAVGNKVIYMQQGYREFRIGTIEKFTKHYVILEKDAPRQLPSQLILFSKAE
jgi:uncharacterized phage-like protein YoqJ